MNNMKSIYLMRILSIAAMLLSFVVTADAQRVRNGFPEITLWEFAFRGEPNSIDCIYNKNNNELFLSGFDTDGKGTFWFAGGSPLRVSCFKGTKLQWRREVSAESTKLALFRLCGDSLYLAHDMNRELIVLSKDGSGTVRHTKLPVDSIEHGVMHEKYFVLRSNELKYNGWRNHFELTFFNYDGSQMLRDTVSREMVEKYMRPAPDYHYQNTRERNNPGITREVYIHYDYKGMFYGMPLYESGFKFYLNTAGEDGEPMSRSYSIEDIFDVDGPERAWPVEPITDRIFDEYHFTLPESVVLRGTHLYETYYQRSGVFTVIDFDVEKIFPEYVENYKKSDDYLGDKELPDIREFYK